MLEQLIDKIYFYTIPIELTITTLLLILLFMQKISKGEEYAPYRRARAYLMWIYILIIIDLGATVKINSMGLDGALIDTIVDIMSDTPIAILFMWFVGTLLDNNYDHRKTVVRDVVIWLVTLAAMIINIFAADEQLVQTIFFVVAAFWACFIAHFAFRIFSLFRKLMKRMDNYYSDNIRRLTKPLQLSVYTFVIWGLFCPVASVCSPAVNTIYSSLGVVVYIMLYNAFYNSYVGYELITKAKVTDDTPRKELTSHETVDIVRHIREWADNKNFRHQGITVESVAAQLDYDQNVLTNIINHNFNSSFHDYITRLRVRDAQELLVHFPTRPIGDIATMVGFTDEKEMNESFRKIANVTPKVWRQGVLGYMTRN